MRQGALAGGLDHRAVGHGVGEGHPQLDEVGAGGHHAVQEGHGEVGIRIAGGDVGHEGGASALAQGLEAGLDAAHTRIPSKAATVWMSLSPRPDRFTSTSAPFPNCWARRRA